MTDTQPETRSPHSHFRWVLLMGVIWLLAAVWIWVSRPGVLVAGHPAYAVLVTMAGILGIVLMMRARKLRGRTRVSRGRWRLALGRAAGVATTLMVIGSVLWLRPFAASDVALDSMSGSPKVRITSTMTRITITPTGTETEVGLVFQPGARVDPRAYIPLLSQISAAGHLVVVVKQPLNIGFTATNAPDAIIEDHPEINEWVIGGHSLGGVAASSYIADHPGEVAGMLLWASYPLDTLADHIDLRVTSVSGTLDALATPDDIQDSRADLPSSTSIVSIRGAVHSFFGDYGDQPGDGTPTVSRSAAQKEIVLASNALMTSVDPGPSPDPGGG